MCGYRAGGGMTTWAKWMTTTPMIDSYRYRTGTTVFVSTRLSTMATSTTTQCPTYHHVKLKEHVRHAANAVSWSRRDSVDVEIRPLVQEWQHSDEQEDNLKYKIRQHKPVLLEQEVHAVKRIEYIRCQFMSIAADRGSATS